MVKSQGKFENTVLKALNLDKIKAPTPRIPKEVAEVKERIKETYEIEPLEDAWKAIAEMKNSESAKEKLRIVKQRMDEGKLFREPQVGKKPKKFTKAEALRLYTKVEAEQRQEKLEELLRTKPDNYYTITTSAEMLEMLKLAGKETLMAIDTETTGLDVYRDETVGYSVSLDKADKHYYVPLLHMDGTNYHDDGNISAMSALAELVGREDTDLVFHNASFDRDILYSNDIEIKGRIHDTAVIMHLMDENLVSYRLKDLAPKYLGAESDTFDTLFKDAKDFRYVPVQYASVYAAKDTHLTLRLYKFLMNYMSKPTFAGVKTLYEEVEQPVISVTNDMERVGFQLDLMEVESQKTFLEQESARLKDELDGWFGSINYNSPQQLGEVIYDKFKLGDYVSFKERNKRSTGKEVLEQLENRHPAIKILIEYRKVSKLLDGFVKKASDKVSPDGRIHAQFKQNGTKTGRYSSKEPNFQNIPPEARKMFIAPKGQLILSADFSQQEPRLLAHYSQDPKLLAFYREGRDLYSEVASETFDVPLDKCGDGTVYRKRIKTVVLAILYGMSPKALANSLGVDFKEAESIMDNFYAKFPSVKNWIDNNAREVTQRGYIEDWRGRRRRFPKAIGKDFDREMSKKTTRAFDWEFRGQIRQITNAKVQGGAATQTKEVMIAQSKLMKKLSTPGRKFEISSQVHDELLFYVPEDITREEVEMIRSVMIETVKFSVPAKTDMAIGKRWCEKYGKYDNIVKEDGLVSVEEWFDK
ncbi:DNA polymerase I [Listeria phage LP-010]|uniref:DNA polymerase I n=1 Tax=Listeria phage LP-010 TaxID=2590046 RepID=A0A514U6G3_9CAUD|nr:DNA polymerase I [Listeria phage LP-010]